MRARGACVTLVHRGTRRLPAGHVEAQVRTGGRDLGSPQVRVTFQHTSGVYVLAAVPNVSGSSFAVYVSNVVRARAPRSRTMIPVHTAAPGALMASAAELARGAPRAADAVPPSPRHAADGSGGGFGTRFTRWPSGSNAPARSRPHLAGPARRRACCAQRLRRPEHGPPDHLDLSLARSGDLLSQLVRFRGSPWHRLYLRPDPHGHGALRSTWRKAPRGHSVRRSTCASSSTVGAL